MDHKHNLYGFHINDSPDVINQELFRVIDYKTNLVQLFIYPDSKYISLYENFRDSAIKKNIKIVVHAPYTINIAAEWDNYSWSINSLIEQIILASKIGAFGIVVHMGKQLKESRESSYNNMLSALLYVHNKTLKQLETKIILETPSGMGTELCYKMEDFAYFFKKLSLNKNENISNRFKICIDTCHIFAAGYDIRDKKSVDQYIKTFDDIIGLRYISLIHLNDSKREIGSNIDRHESLGKGYIGKDGLKYITKLFKQYSIPIILETPSKYHHSEIKDYLSI